MQNHRVGLVAALLLSSVFSTNAQAQESDKTHCNWENPEVTAQRSRLAPWFVDLNKKIDRQSGYNKLANAMHKDLKEDACVTCFLALKRDGSVEQLDVHSPWAAELKEPTTVVVRGAAPFPNPPVEVVFPTQIQIKFQKENGTITISSHLVAKPIINGRIGQ